MRAARGGPEQPYQHRATIIERVGGIPIEGHCLVEARHGLLVALQRRERDAALKVRIKFLRGQRKRAVETRERLGWPTELEADLAAPQVGRRRIGCKSQSTVEARKRLGRSFEAHER